MDITQIKDLLKRYQEGGGTEEEILLIDRWLDENYGKDENAGYPADMDERLRVIKANIDRSISGRVFNWKRFISIAAIFFLFVSTSIFFLYTGFRKKQYRAEGTKEISRLESNGWVTIYTPKGVTHSFILPDGSSVVLNASSTIRYPVQFPASKRAVYLDEGEAFFSVAKDRKKAFTVFTSGFATTALGTAFNVRSYQKEHIISVALIQGKVRVENLKTEGKSSPSILGPHQKIVLNTISDEVENKVFKDITVVTGWSDGILSFDNASAEEVITSIENRFDVSIDNKSEIKDWKYTGTFKEESLKEVLETICLTEGITYKKLSKDSIQIN